MSLNSLSSEYTPLIQFNVCLNAEGNRIQIVNTGGPSTLEEREARKCKTHEAVLQLLLSIQRSGIKDTYRFRHLNTTESGHKASGMKEVGHDCTLESQIQFVTSKIIERSRDGSSDSCEGCLTCTLL